MTEKEIGKITHYFGKISVGIIALSEPLKVGDTIRIKGSHSDFTQIVDSLQAEHKKIDMASAGESVGLRVASIVHENDRVFKVLS